MERNPKFFKVILDDREGKLTIPRKFVRNHLNGVSSPVFLQVPGGALWQMQLLERDGEIWLEKGFPEFQGYYSLKFGQIIVFEHVKASHFHVIILDKSGSEIEYPFGSINSPKMEEKKDNISVEVLDDLSLCRKTGDQSPFPHPRKWMQVKCKEKPIGQPKGASSSLGTCRALEAADNFTSEYPFFKVVLRPYNYVHNNVIIPYSFFKRHFKHKAKSAVLQIANTMWPVKFRHNSRKYAACFGSGWCAFSKGNSLEAGDVCVFELIKNRVLKVSILSDGH